jgi:hypothetical protein
MQELFSKVNTEKRHLYGENGILGHRRAISTTIPSKSISQGHRRTHSNTSSDFKAIFCTNPALLEQIEQSIAKPSCEMIKTDFPKHLNKAYDYFVLSILPNKLLTEREKLKNSIKNLTDCISRMQKTQLQLINKKNEIKGKLKQENEFKNHSEAILSKCKKRANELEILLKKTQEELKSEKMKIAKQKEGFNKSLSIDTEEMFMFQKVTPKGLYINCPNFPLTPTSKFYNSSNNPSPINS